MAPNPTSTPTPACRAPRQPPAPREHGAWGILLIPFATAVGVSGVWDLKLALLLVSILGFYLARTSWLKGNWQWTAGLLAVSATAAAPLLFGWDFWWLLAFGAVAAPLGFRKTERGLAMQLLAVAGLTLTAPAAWYVATGELDGRLWLLNALYFTGGVLHVKMHLAAAMNRHRAAAVQANLWFHGLLPLGLGALALAGWLTPWVIAAFIPALARAVVGAWRLTPVLRIKRLGWSEVAWSLLYAAGLIALWRAGS